jgi:uncharacterized glyoxalase superfamily protein PhnB
LTTFTQVKISLVRLLQYRQPHFSVSRTFNQQHSTQGENNMPDVIPMLSYENGTAALDWLARVFGFVELQRMVTPDGILAHGEMQAGDGIIMLATPSPDYQSPKTHRENCAAAKALSAYPWIIDGVLVQVDSVDEHYKRAKAGGAAILSEPEAGPPARRYRVEDFEGHRWMFMERE